VLGLIDHAEVLAPADVRAHVVDWLEQMVGTA
jgi:predicted DNA-binding transcriptional regulator YafY